MDGFYTQRAFHRVREHPKRSSNEEVIHIASREENQQFTATAVAAAATVFCHFWTSCKLNIVLSYILMDSRLKGLSIESKNTQNGVRTKKLCASEVGGLTLCRGYAIAWNPTPRCARGCTSHATAWLPRPGVPEDALAALVHARFQPETISEQPLSTGDNILPI